MNLYLKSRQLYRYFADQHSCFRAINYNAIPVALVSRWYRQKSVIRCYHNLSKGCAGITSYRILKREQCSTI